VRFSAFRRNVLWNATDNIILPPLQPAYTCDTYEYIQFIIRFECKTLSRAVPTTVDGYHRPASQLHTSFAQLKWQFGSGDSGVRARYTAWNSVRSRRFDVVLDRCSPTAFTAHTGSPGRPMDFGRFPGDLFGCFVFEFELLTDHCEIRSCN
jgi:hypothetical protein